MHSPLKEALKRRRGKSLDLTIMIAPEGPPKDDDASEESLAEESRPRALHKEESPEEELSEMEGEDSDASEDLIAQMSDREKQKLMEEEPKTLLEKVKRLALMRGNKV